MLKKTLLLLFIFTSFAQAQAQSLNLLSPSGGENWAAGSVKLIQWAYSNVDYVKIEYSVDSGATYTVIAPSVEASFQSYHWTVPSTMSPNCYIKITSLQSPIIYSTNAAIFTILEGPYINLTAPNGAEVLNEGTTFQITWNSYQTSQILKVEYSINDGATWLSIADTIYNFQYYFWTVPATPSTYCKIRVSDVYNSQLFDESDFVFTINAPSVPLYLIAPNGGETWAAGYPQAISWTSTGVNNIKIELSLDLGANWTVLESSIPASSGYYYWAGTAAYATSQALIKISDVANSNQFDISDMPFNITIPPPVVIVTSPNGGEQIALGATYNILWWAVSINDVRIEYSINNGQNWNLIAASVPASAGTYTWNVPNVNSISALIRVTDNSNAAITDQSDATFSIINPSISLTGFPSGTMQNYGDLLIINWNSTGINNELLKLEYTTDFGVSWQPIASNVPNTSFYAWQINCLPTDSCKIRISLQNNPSVFDVSDGAVKIIANSPAIVVLNPNNPGPLGSGTVYPITWFSYMINNVRIELSINGDTVYNLLTALAPASNGVYYWNIPPSLTATSCRIKISNAANTSLSSLSPSFFNIQPGTIHVTSGNFTTNYLSGSSYPITWTNSGIGNYVNINYSVDGGTTWLPIIANYQNNGTYLWNLPYLSTNTLIYKVEDATNPIIFDVNDANLTIVPANNPLLEIVEPGTGNTFAVGSHIQIKWLTSGIDFINIDYSSDGGSTWTAIAGNINTQINYYNWTFPANNISNGKIRITNSVNSANFDTINFSTDQSFISLSAPNGGETWGTALNQYITWQSLGVTHVNLYYSDNGGNTWQIIDSNKVNTGYYNWLTPTTIGSNYKIKITNSDNIFMFDESNNVFSLTTPSVSLSLLSPNGGEQLISNQGSYIDWQCNTLSNLNIAYSLDGGLTYFTIAQNVPSIPSFYYWMIPDTFANNAKIKISVANNPGVSDVSAAGFKIIKSQPSLQLLWPNGSESLCKNAYASVKWSANNCDYVNLYYSTNGGTTYTLISSIMNDSVYTWQVPNVVGNNFKIKVEHGNDTSIYDASDAVFSIMNCSSVGNQLVLSAPSVSSICSGNQLTLDYNITGNFNASNNFRVQISTNQFSNFTDIGGINNSNTSGSIIVSIPEQTAAGSNYSIRVVSTNPPMLSNVVNNIQILSANANFSASNTLSLLPNAQVTLIPASTSAALTSSLWNISNGSTSTAYTPVLNFYNAGKYMVKLTVTDTSGCTGTVIKNNYLFSEHLFNTMLLNVPNQNELTDIDFDQDRYGCAIYKNGNCLITADTGKTWTLAYTNSNTVQLNSISTQGNMWYITLEDGTCLRSNNKGLFWLPVSFNNSISLKDLLYISNTNMIAVGGSGKIFKYNGIKWVTQNSGTSKTLNKAASNNFVTMVVGEQGTILKQQPNNSWAPISSPLNINYNDLAFKDSLYGFIAGDFGYILKTENGGTSWSVALSGADINFKSITCSGDSVWAVGSKGIVYTSQNNGNTWNRYSIGSNTDLNRVYYKNNKGYVAGKTGLLRSFNHTLYTPVVNAVKKNLQEASVTLFPNPGSNFVNLVFSSELTARNYQLFITDISGKKVFAEQFNSTPGASKQIDIHTLQNGIYFVCLISENQYQTYKLVKSE